MAQAPAATPGTVAQGATHTAQTAQTAQKPLVSGAVAFRNLLKSLCLCSHVSRFRFISSAFTLTLLLFHFVFYMTLTNFC